MGRSSGIMKTVKILLITSLLSFLSMEVLSEAEESFTEKYALSSRGYDFQKVLERVSSIFELDKDYITEKCNQADRVKASDLLCYWCNNKIGISMADLAGKLGLTSAAV